MIDVTIRWAKELRTPEMARALGPIAEALALTGQLIRARILNQNVDADGKKLPALARKGSYYVETTDTTGKTRRRREVTSVRADRTDGNLDTDQYVRIKADGEWRNVSLYTGGYRTLKTLLGARPQRDGELTGSLWRSLSVRVGKSKKGAIRVRLYFAGNDRKQKTFKKLENGKTQKRSVRQRTKAEALMFTEREVNDAGKVIGAGRPAFELLRMNREERLFFLRKTAEIVRRLFAAG